MGESRKTSALTTSLLSQPGLLLHLFPIVNEATEPAFVISESGHFRIILCQEPQILPASRIFWN